MDQLETLIDLLTCGHLEPDEVRERAANVRNAAEDPNLDWLDEPSDDELMQVAVQFQLTDFFAIGDKVDEVHELIAGYRKGPTGPRTGSHRARALSPLGRAATMRPHGLTIWRSSPPSRIARIGRALPAFGPAE